ncbi:MAG: hypothetical protein HKN85_11770 [Gammaproteobacteria bacterium]|nr:hypothetical protein [Gammaproteobacteria bacterium]
MSAKPSRSEIETAVAGRTKPVKRRKRPPERVEFQLDSPAPRRQQVIGGDLTGVSKYQKFRRGRLGSSLAVNYVNWIAGVIVLMIVVAFFWPHPKRESTKEVAGTPEKVESAPFYSESRVDEEQNATIDQSFIRETDLDRAGEFREQEARDNQIRELLSEAENHLAKGEYSLPKGGNAVAAYREVLQIDPRNVKAKQGLDYINGRFLATGLKALEDNNRNLAISSLEKLKNTDTQSDEYQQMSAALAQWDQGQKIKGLLANARRAMQEQSLILPARQSALHYYQQVLEIDAANAAALEGVQSIADNYSEKANSAVIAGEYEAAAGYLATVSVIDPRHPSIKMIKEMLASAQPLAANTGSRTTGSSTATAVSEPPLDTGNSSRDNVISDNPTPGKEAREQEAFDLQYLQRGLDAYYQAEYDTAAALLKPLADKGVSRAQFRIGYMYYKGRGFDEDRQEADRIIRAALPAIQSFADEGRAWAQSDLGSLYEEGLVLPRDYSEAVYWYRTAAEQGYPGAQTNLGIMYAEGRGVTASRRTAIEWFQRAAKQGDTLARRNLEVLGKTP